MWRTAGILLMGLGPSTNAVAKVVRQPCITVNVKGGNLTFTLGAGHALSIAITDRP
jgi:hypothetical protein